MTGVGSFIRFNPRSQRHRVGRQGKVPGPAFAILRVSIRVHSGIGLEAAVNAFIQWVYSLVSIRVHSGIGLEAKI